GISDPDRDCGARDSVHRAAHRADLRVADTAAPHGSPHRSRSDRGAAAGRDRGLERARPAALARHAGSRGAAAAGGTAACARAGRRARDVRAGTGGTCRAGRTAVAGIALLIAAVFFLRYSVEHGWLQPPVRAAIGLFVGVSLLVVCELKAARQYDVTANAIGASAIAILFATFFAAHALWNLIP